MHVFVTTIGRWSEKFMSGSKIAPHISETNRARKLKFGTLAQAFAGTMATYKNLSAMGRLGRSAAPIFILGPPPYLRN